jgi:CRISPR-associated endonuclease/helicase Cas3
MFLAKFVFSALIDADRTNTRIFETNQPDEPTDGKLFATYYDRVVERIQFLREQEDANSPINRLRNEMSEQCDRFADRPSGIYTLSIPTGGGKTLASLRYALKHAIGRRKKHIIYVVPYTTIIEQNAGEVRKILRDETNILEHHSNLVEDAEDDENQEGLATVQQKLKLAKDNWDSPIIFTTMVQFLNVFYAYGSRNIRRLHNLCEAVIIFDEVQKVPVSCISLFNQALNFLKAYGNCSIVLCTATQPALDFVEQKLEIAADAEMIENLDNVIEAFRRVEIIDRATHETFNNDKLAEFIATTLDGVKSLLVILNTRSVVRDLYQRLKTRLMEIPVYHLSTSMCAAHRNQILGEIREQLSEGNKIICVSTQLIEAGVDVSFDGVIRSLAGLDSIAQAAGRCNRHGKKEIQKVYVIDHSEEKLDKLKEIQKGKELARKIFIDLKRDPTSHGGRILSRQAMERYFQEYYKEYQTHLNYFIPKLTKYMTELLYSDKKHNTLYQAYIRKTNERLPLFIANSYRTAAEHFHVIDHHTTTVVVPYGEGKEIIAELNGSRTIDDLSRLLRRAQQYTVNLYDQELQQLEINGGLACCLGGKVLVLKERAYHEEFGFDIDSDSAMGLLIT